MDKPADHVNLPLSVAEQQQFDQLLQQYHDFFVIEQAVLANISPLPTQLPTYEQFLLMIPEPFLMASEQAGLDRTALKSLAKLGELAEELTLYLRSQARKIDMLMRYLLIQQDNPAFRCHTQSFGGSALNFISNSHYRLGQTLEVKLFLNGSDGAVYFLATVLDASLQPPAAVSQSATIADPAGELQQTPAVAVATNPLQPCYLVRAVVSLIRDEDREVLVRASLHEQSKQLKQKALLRQQGKS